jgi:hypothetical protein
MMSRRVTVATCSNATEAALKQGLLANAGIEAFVLDEHGGTILPSTLGPIEVQVEVGRINEALRVLNEGTQPRHE